MTGFKRRDDMDTVEAIQFMRNTFEKTVEFTAGKAFNLTIERRINGKAWCYIPTPYGNTAVNETDYIVKLSDGSLRKYTCKAFEETYNL